MRHRICAVALLVFCAGSSLAHAANPALPAQSDLQEMIEAKAFRPCLQNIARILLLTGDAAKAYDRGELLLMRGECLVQLSDGFTAMITYEQIVKDSSVSYSQADQARAMLAVIKRSPGLLFKPPLAAASSKPLDIKDSAQRKQAMEFLFQEQLASQAQAIKGAQEAKSLPPIIKALPDLRTVHALEVGGTGADAQTRPLLISIGEHARDLITTELDRVSTETERIRKNADAIVTAAVSGARGRWGGYVSGRAGLSIEDRNTLRASIEYTQNIVDVSERGRQAAIAFGADGKNWEPVIEKAQSTLREAQEVLAAE